MITTLSVLAFALALDLLVGEPPTAAHPVAWFGRLVGALDREWTSLERGQLAVGVAIAAVLPLCAAAVAWLLVAAAADVAATLGALAAGVVLFLTASLRALLDRSREVLAATEGEIERARELVGGLVGRDPSALSPAGIRSAVVESASENLADGYAATLLPFAFLAPVSLPAAAAAATWVKAVNTLDSMVGYPGKSIGTASARLDDAVMWLPARATAGAIALASFRPTALARARPEAGVPASPNSGWPMATAAVALGVRLEKPGAYVLAGGEGLPTPADGERAIRLVGLAAAILVGFALALAALSPAVVSTATSVITVLVDLLVAFIESLLAVVRAGVERLVRAAAGVADRIATAVSPGVEP